MYQSIFVFFKYKFKKIYILYNFIIKFANRQLIY